jgi:predicted RNase H-like nuclease (RuvC/YqgF family)
MKSGHVDEGWVMIVLLSCLVVAFSLVTIGLGLVNVAEAKPIPPAILPAESPPVRPPAPDPAAKEEFDRQKAALGVREEQLRQLKQELEAALKRLEELKNQLTQREKERQELAARIGEKDQAGAAQQAKLVSQEELRARLEVQINELRRQIKDLEERIAKWQRELEKRLSNVVDPAELFGASASGKNPQWIDCVQDGVVILPQRQKITTDAVKKKDRALVEAFGRGYAVFLIRPQGFQAFRAARTVAEEMHIDIGFEPYDAGWKLPEETGRM